MDTDGTAARDADQALFGGAAWFDPIEAGLRERIRGFLEELFEQELTDALGRRRHERGSAADPAVAGHRHGTRRRRLMGSFGPVEVAVPRARLAAEDGTTREWRSAALPRYARMTRQVEALIAGAYLAGTNTRRVKRALATLFRGAVGKDVVSRTWRKEGRLGGLGPAQPGRGGHRPPHSAWHRGAGPPRPQSHGHLLRRARRPPRRPPEGAARGQEHGWGERSRVARRAR
jgi:hypothetical protein